MLTSIRRLSGPIRAWFVRGPRDIWHLLTGELDFGDFLLARPKLLFLWRSRVTIMAFAFGAALVWRDPAGQRMLRRWRKRIMYIAPKRLDAAIDNMVATPLQRKISEHLSTENFRVHSASSDAKFAGDITELVLGRVENAALGLAHYLCVPERRILHGMADDMAVAAMQSEFVAHGTLNDRECLRYVLEDEAGGSDVSYPPHQLKRDCDGNGELLPSRRTAGGKPMRLADFVALPEATQARLTPAHVAALRVYTTAAFTSLNGPLRDRSRYEAGTAHGFPVTVSLIADAVKKLRVNSKVMAPPSPTGERKPTLTLWRGMRNRVTPEDFLVNGGTELAPMSTSSDLSIAVRYAASAHALLLRLDTCNLMERGADISFLSVFPSEREYLFPPLVYLDPTGEVETHDDGECSFTIVGVRALFPS